MISSRLAIGICSKDFVAVIVLYVEDSTLFHFRILGADELRDWLVLKTPARTPDVSPHKDLPARTLRIVMWPCQTTKRIKPH